MCGAIKSNNNKSNCNRNRKHLSCCWAQSQSQATTLVLQQQQQQDKEKVVLVLSSTLSHVFSVLKDQPPLFTPRARVRNLTGFFIHQPIQIHIVQLEERILGTFFLVKNVLSHGHRSFMTVALDCCPNGNKRQAMFAAVVGENHCNILHSV